ncbi:hypothetical protein P4113_20810 [Pseudomonas aeruginosa]|nr:hypothetical protein [Pseudomonas aeruginosa]
MVRKKTETYNVVAETRRGLTEQRGDGRRAPRLGVRRSGINDNGSGSAA